MFITHISVFMCVFVCVFVLVYFDTVFVFVSVYLCVYTCVRKFTGQGTSGYRPNDETTALRFPVKFVKTVFRPKILHFSEIA